MKKKIKELDQVVVKNLAQLHKAIEPFKTESSIYKLLRDGMDIAKRHMEFAKRAKEFSEEEYGGYIPAKPVGADKGYMWVDTIIARRLDGKRDGTNIVWELPEGKYEFNPWTRELKQVDNT